MRRGLFLVSLPIFFINFSLPIQARGLSASAFEIGLLFSIFTFSLLVFRPIVGYGLDRIGRKLFVCLALLFYACAHICFAFADSMIWMYLARLTQGVGAALLLITVDTITADLTDADNRPTEMGRNLEVQTRSSIVGATIGFTFVGAASTLAWFYSFGLFALAAIAGFLFLLFRFKETRQPTPVMTGFTMTTGLKRLIAIVFLTGFASALIQPIYLIFLQDKFNLPIDQMAAAFLPGAIVFAVLPSRAGRISRHTGTLNLFLLGTLLSGLVYLSLPFMQGILMFVVVYTIASIGWALAEPARKSVTTLLTDDTARGRSFGMIELYAGIGATAGPPLGGLIYDNFGATTTFVGNGLLLVVTTGIAWILLRRYSVLYRASPES